MRYFQKLSKNKSLYFLTSFRYTIFKIGHKILFLNVIMLIAFFVIAVLKITKHFCIVNLQINLSYTFLFHHKNSIFIYRFFV